MIVFKWRMRYIGNGTKKLTDEEWKELIVAIAFPKLHYLFFELFERLGGSFY